ncbi:DgyrCDS6253 [Dimorphilus gyrociliatus]|uniref:DNA 5'-3' helicase n=1 Tax=Dimorphilus gyrociliatus TaxID=2664684 RepID=A0A7I8VMH4_9ANNE|nr:DgyrCDS6253 [Dimorphilus gyrociliatus]
MQNLTKQIIKQKKAVICAWKSVNNNDAVRYHTEENANIKAQNPSAKSSILNEADYSKKVGLLTIKKFLGEKKMVYDIGHTCVITTCPKHSLRKLHLKQIEKLFINSTTGHFVCQSCGKNGSFESLCENINTIYDIYLDKTKKSPAHKCFQNINVNQFDDAIVKSTEFWSTQERVANAAFATNNLMIKAEILEKYKVRILKEQTGFIFPLIAADGRIRCCKIFYFNQPVGKQQRYDYVPALSYLNGASALFGWNTIRSNNNEIVITADEFDAMSVHQATNLPCVALPTGATLPQQVLPLFEQFQKIILWLGGDQNTWGTARQLAKKLGESRCRLIRPSNDCPSAHKALKKGLDLVKIIDSAKPIRHESITSFFQLRQEVFTELSEVELVAGVKWKRYPQLVKLLKGHRRGELTVFTGPTGSGKTTFISEYSLDLCTQGVNTLWGSFEISNVRLLKTMLTQFARQKLTQCSKKDYDKWADLFEKLPMYFMTFHGQQQVNRVIETMSHAVYIHDIAHIVVDNLQFMMGLDNAGMASDRFLKQDQIIAAFRKFATHMNCHVTLVIHPRKENETDNLTVSSIFGSAKASQEADNILILQDKRFSMVRGKKYIQVAKNRFDGDLGIVLLNFDKDSLSFTAKKKLAPGLTLIPVNDNEAT